LEFGRGNPEFGGAIMKTGGGFLENAPPPAEIARPVRRMTIPRQGRDFSAAQNEGCRCCALMANAEASDQGGWASMIFWTPFEPFERSLC